MAVSEGVTEALSAKVSIFHPDSIFEIKFLG